MYHRHSQQSTGQREELGIVNVASTDIFQANDSGRLLISLNELFSRQIEFNIQKLVCITATTKTKVLFKGASHDLIGV